MADDGDCDSNGDVCGVTTFISLAHNQVLGMRVCEYEYVCNIPF